MKWEAPEVTEITCGLEVTAYSSAELPDDGELI
jgi:coenzyme PQQ precursor peptide PqqA